MKNFLILTILTFCFQYCFAFCFSLGDFSMGEDCNKKEPELTSSQLEHEVHSRQKLALRDIKHSVIIRSKPGEFRKEIKIIGVTSEASYSAVCPYIMKIGFDFGKMQILLKGHDIVVKYPHAEIISYSKDGKCETRKQSDGWLIKIHVEDVAKMEEEAVAKAKVEAAFLHEKEAIESLTDQIEDILSKLLKDRHEDKEVKLIDITSKDQKQKLIINNKEQIIYTIKFVSQDEA